MHHTDLQSVQLETRRARSDAPYLVHSGARMVALIVFASLALAGSSRASTNVALAWDPNLERDLAGYTIYYGNSSGQYANAVPVGLVTNALVNGLLEGRTYYFVVTASNTNGLESDPSNEVNFTPGGAIPLTLSSIANQTTSEDQARSVSFSFRPGSSGGAVNFTASSSNPGVATSVSFSGSGTNRTALITPATNASGSTVITITGNDGTTTGSTSFTLTVNPVNDRPVISAIQNQSLLAGTVANVPFVVRDVETAPGSLSVTWNSSNQAVLPNSNMVVSGSGTNRILILTAPANAFGTSVVQVSVSDGALAASTSFNVVIGNTNEIRILAGVYRGLFYEDNAVRHESSGAFTITTTANKSYTGLLRFGARRLEFSGKLNFEGRATNRIRLATGVLNPTNSLLLTFQVGANRTPDQVVGTISRAGWNSGLLGDRATFHARTNVAPFVGRYTLQLPGQAPSVLGPQGDGIGAVVVASNGLVTLTGALGDTLAMTHSSALSKEGHWPFYLPLYAGRGSILGWLNVSNRVTEDINGQVSWIRPTTVTAKFFKTGFTNEMFASGSRYISPATPTNAVLNLSEAGLTFLGGNLAQVFTNDVMWNPGNRFSNLSSNALTIALVPKSGLFSGRVLDPVSRRFYPFRGALLQKQNIGCGFLTGTNETSRVRLTAED